MKRPPTHPSLRKAIVSLDEATAKVKPPEVVDPLAELRAWRIAAARRFVWPSAFKAKK